MGVTYPYGETIVIRHPAAPLLDGDGKPLTDGYGEPILGEPTEETVEGVPVAPGDTRENTDRQDTASIEFTIYPPPGTVIEPTAEVVVRGVVCQVEGEGGTPPAEWVNPFTDDRPGLEVALRRAQ